MVQGFTCGAAGHSPLSEATKEVRGEARAAACACEGWEQVG